MASHAFRPHNRLHATPAPRPGEPRHVRAIPAPLLAMWERGWGPRRNRHPGAPAWMDERRLGAAR